MLSYTADLLDKPCQCQSDSNKEHKCLILLQLESGREHSLISPGKPEGLNVAQGSVQALKGD